MRGAAVARAGWGCVLLVATGRVLRVGGRPPAPPAALAVARVLGARQLVQAAVTAVRPGGPVAGVSAAVDALHAATDVALAAVAPRWRRIALADTAVAAALAAAGWRARRR